MNGVARLVARFDFEEHKNDWKAGNILLAMLKHAQNGRTDLMGLGLQFVVNS